MSSAQPDVPEFLVDRSLGRHLVPEAIARLGFTVHTLASIWGEKEAQLLDDTVWLERAGQEGWLCLMKDKITKRPANCKALRDHAVKAFCLTSGGLTGDQQAEWLAANINRIVQHGKKPGPFVCAVHRLTVVRMCPKPEALTRRQQKLMARS